MGQPLRLRLIDGGLEPRVAVAAAPDLPAQTFPDRIPLPRARFEAARMLAGVTIALAIHAGILAYAMQYAGDEEARAEGGADSVAVIEGISVITMDSIDSTFSDGMESLPEAVAAQDAPPTEAMPTDNAAIATADTDASAVPDTMAATLPDETAALEPTEPVEPVPVDEAPIAAAVEAATSDAAQAETIPTEVVAKSLDVGTVVAPSTDAYTAETTAGEIVAADSDVVTAAPVTDAETAVVRADSATPVEPIDDTVATAAISDMPEAVAVPEDTVVAAQDVTPPEVKPEPPPQPKPKPPRQAKPAPKPAKPAAQPPARRSQESTASVAEQAARGPKPGTAGAGGSSSSERGKASLSSYQSKLSAHLRRHRVYPAAARSQGLRGTAVVTFTVNGSGKVTRASLAKSSGHGILDEAAVQMVRRASPFPPIPAGLGQNSITISAPVRFDTR